jgi:hypothetical protein
MGAMLRPFVFMAALGTGLMSPFDPPNLLPMVDDALKRFSDTSLAFIERSFRPVKAETVPIDAAAVANLDEDLDWRIASRDKTIATWLAFLDKHPNGQHAREAQAALDELTGSAPPTPVPNFAPVVGIANARPPAPDLFAALERPPPPETKSLEVERTVAKWREPRTRYVTLRRYERPATARFTASSRSLQARRPTKSPSFDRASTFPPIITMLFGEWLNQPTGGRTRTSNSARSTRWADTSANIAGIGSGHSGGGTSGGASSGGPGGGGSGSGTGGGASSGGPGGGGSGSGTGGGASSGGPGGGGSGSGGAGGGGSGSGGSGGGTGGGASSGGAGGGGSGGGGPGAGAAGGASAGGASAGAGASAGGASAGAGASAGGASAGAGASAGGAGAGGGAASAGGGAASAGAAGAGGGGSR